MFILLKLMIKQGQMSKYPLIYIIFHNENQSFSYLPPSGRGLRPVPSAGALLHIERQKIVIWRRPFLTVYYFLLELFWLFIDGLIA